MKTKETTNWTRLLGDVSQRNRFKRWSCGEVSTRRMTQYLVGTSLAGDFRKLVRTYGTTYGRRLARKALNRRTV